MITLYNSKYSVVHAERLGCFCLLFVYIGVRFKPRVYCSLLAYCTARF
jgi:hypothetical protein